MAKYETRGSLPIWVEQLKLGVNGASVRRDRQNQKGQINLNMSKSFFSLFSVAALSLGLTIPAGATTVLVGGAAPVGAVATVFGTSLALSSPGIWTGTAGTGTANASVLNSYTDPLNSGYFAYAESGSTVTATFTGGITSLDLLWGSPDTFNTITFNSANGSKSYSPGVGALSGLTATQTGGTMVLFTATSGTVWTSVDFTSSTNSFEFGQVSTVAAPAPEPASIALLGGGLLAIGAGAIRRRKSA